MSLARPAYTFTVENRTQGWTYTCTEGPDDDPDAPVKLLDNMSHKWGFAQDRIPGPFEPATLSFRLGADRVADLPEVHINDVILARLDRAEAVEYAWTGTPNLSTSQKLVNGEVVAENLETSPRLGAVLYGWVPTNATTSSPDGTFTRITSTTSVVGLVNSRLTVSSIRPLPAGSGGKSFTVSVDTRSLKSARIRINFYDASTTLLTAISSDPFGGTGDWVRGSAVFTAPPNAEKFALLIGNGVTPLVGDTWDFRHVRVAPSDDPAPTEYFDGDTPDVPGSTYFTFGGRVTDPVVALDPHASKPAQMTVTAVEFLTDLANVFPVFPETHAPWDPDVPWTYELFHDQHAYLNDLLILKTRERIRALVPSGWRAETYPEPPDYNGSFLIKKEDSTIPLGDVINRLSNSKPIEAAPGRRYVAYPRPVWHEHPPVPTDAGPGTWYPLDRDAANPGIYLGWDTEDPLPTNPNPIPDEPGIWYWITPITRHLGTEAAVLALVWPAGAPYATVEVAPDADERDGLIYLDACNVRTPLSARKGREHVVDRVSITGAEMVWRADLSGSSLTITDVAEPYPATSNPNAPVSRSIETTAIWSRSAFLPESPTPWAHLDTRFMVDWIGPAFLSDASVNSQQWSFDSIDVTTWTMDDNELDLIAPRFFPEAPSAGVLEPRVLTQLIVDGIDPDVLTDPPFLTAVVTGATHTITGGRLLIKPNLVGGVLPVNPTSTDAVTAADLLAAGTPWSDLLTAETIDPALTALDFRLIGAPA